MKDDLIRRSDVLELLESSKRPGYLETIEIQKIPAVDLGDKLVPERPLKLFTKKLPGGRKEYRYGTEGVMMQLLKEGGFRTPEEAKAAWSQKQKR